MKKGVVLIVLIGMFSWAIYDFALSDSENAQRDNEKAEDVLAEAEQDSDSIGLQKGNIAPDLELKTLDNKIVKLSDLRGERVMLNFWASWCGPCRAEMPDMQKFYEEKDIAILAVNLTDTEIGKKNVTEFVEKYNLTFPVLLDEDGEISHLYRIQPIPTSFFIDSNGRVHSFTYGAMNYDQMVQEFEKME
ncbi:peroxiredoxin family protein [Ornithinibacillus halophilus]|uniref:Peroxiredoxin n=1 Tax=Ornithinibacillus halophilus TaxID=930117 RepID=A0A1M5EWB9_9BACI|nr:TlpA disulfide reductase family protein [Ornithinibacillus halophilus]SHF83342.1 Peroxiredoxin [Ornithinibacillus halophilus]